MLEVMPVLLSWRFHSSICWHTSPASSYYINGPCLVLLFVSFGAYGHLGDKLEFIENGVHICIFYDVFDVGVFAGSSFIEVSHLYIIGIFILSLLDSSCRPESNKLEFAQFGAHMRWLWQFWFYCFHLVAWVLCCSPMGGSTAGHQR